MLEVGFIIVERHKTAFPTVSAPESAQLKESLPFLPLGHLLVPLAQKQRKNLFKKQE